MENNHQEISLPEDLDVEEVSHTSNETSDIVYAGVVETWRVREFRVREFAEKEKVRLYITGIVLSVWAIGIVASAFSLLITGNFLLVIPPALISPPLYIVLKFYFGSG